MRAPSQLRLEAAALIERLSAEREGRWYAAEDIDRMIRDIDVAMNGGGAAKQAKLCDIYSQIIALTQGESPKCRRCDQPLVGAMGRFYCSKSCQNGDR
jgi:hypothetical protein